MTEIGERKEPGGFVRFVVEKLARAVIRALAGKVDGGLPRMQFTFTEEQQEFRALRR